MNIAASGTVLVLLGVLLSMTGCSGGKKSEDNTYDAVYPVQQVSMSETDVTRDYAVTLRGKSDVEVRPQISGQLVQLAVKEGDKVRKGQLLFRIDDVQYREQVNAARAALNVAETKVQTAELAAKNSRELSEAQVIGDFALQSAENDLAVAKADAARLKAQLASAEKNLSFTRVVAPSDGVVGTIPLRVGSLVSPSSPEPLTIVSDVSEVYAYFSLSERALLASPEMREGHLSEVPPLTLSLVDGSTYAEEGRIETVSGVINPSTGSVTVRALFPNPDGILRSGSTGTVHLPTVMKDVVAVPQTALYQLQDKYFIYVVSEESTVASREVTIAPQDDGKCYYILSGLKEGETVVTNGVVTLRDGMKIQTKPASSASTQA